jgi:hypothetical protein
VRVDLIAAGGGVIAIEERDIPPLCPVIECGKNGARHTMSIEAIMPEHPGNYTLRVAIDPAARIIERSRTNNVAEIPVAVVPLQIADVEVSAIRVDGTSAGNFVEDGSLLTVAATIKNVGAAPAHDVLAILLSGSAQLTQLAIPELAVGEARVVQAVKIANARGGDELVFHAVAHVASGRELNEDNNKATIVLRVRSHLLEMAISSPLQSVAPGGRLLVPLTIHNGGNAVDHVTARLDGVPQGWSAALLPQPLLVAPNATTRAVLLVDPSANALRGLHNVSVTLLLPSGATAAALDVPVLVAPNGGEVVLATTPPTLQVGENALLVSIQNAANMDLAGLLHADVPQGWTSAPVELAVSAFATAQRTLRILVPPGAAGAFDVTLRVLGRDDSGGMTSGAADAGVDHATGAGHGGSAGAGMGPSSGAATIRVEVRQTMRGTLSWSDVRGSESADPGLQAAELVGLISNAGNVETAFVLTSEQMPQGVVLDPVTTGPLAPGESEAFTARLLVPAGTFQSTTGRVLVAAVVDDQGHDATSWPLPRLDRRPDLVVEAWSLSPAAGVKPGDALRLTADVTNLGASAAPATRLYAYVDGQLAAVVDVPPLEPDASWAVNLTWTAREPGEHIVTLTADAASEVAEASEDNNGFSSPVSVDRRLLDRVTPTPPVPLLAASLLALALLAANRRRR